MRGDRTEIAKAELFDGVVRYSRIDPHEDSDDSAERVAPIFEGVEVAEISEPDSRKRRAAPDVRPPADELGRGRRRSSFGVFFAFAIFAFLAGVGVLAGSFYYLTVAKVKKPVVASDSTTAVAFLPVSGAAQTLSGATPPDSQPAAAAANDKAVEASPEKVTTPPDFSAANESSSQLVVRVEPAEKPVAEAPVAKTPALRTTPETEAEPAPSSPAPEASAPLVRGPSEQGAAVIEALPAPAESPAPLSSTDDPLAPSSEQTAGITAETSPGDPVSIVPNAEDAPPVPPADIPEAPLATAPAGDQQQAAIAPLEPIDPLTDQGGAAATAAQPGDVGIEVIPAPALGTDGDVTTEGGADPYQSALDNWRVLSVKGGVAVIDGRERGVFMVQRGSEIPGVGIVEAIKKRHGRWTVITSVGYIASASVDERGWRPLRFLERRRYLTR